MSIIIGGARGFAKLIKILVEEKKNPPFLTAGDDPADRASLILADQSHCFFLVHSEAKKDSKQAHLLFQEVFFSF